jgi:hypothetical protein
MLSRCERVRPRRTKPEHPTDFYLSADDVVGLVESVRLPLRGGRFAEDMFTDAQLRALEVRFAGASNFQDWKNVVVSRLREYLAAPAGRWFDLTRLGLIDEAPRTPGDVAARAGWAVVQGPCAWTPTRAEREAAFARAFPRPRWLA